MADKEQFYSFEEALKELRLKEEELKRLVSEGEIRAFREGDTMRLRRADVDNLRAELSGGEIVDLGEESEELVFEDDTLDAGMATEAIGMEPADVADVDEAETVVEQAQDELELEAEPEEEPEERARPPAPLRATRVETVEPYEGAGLRALLVLTTLLLVAGVPVVMAATNGTFSVVARTIAGLFGGG